MNIPRRHFMSGEGSGGLSWTRTGALIPSDNSPSKGFARLFLEGRADEVKEQMRMALA